MIGPFLAQIPSTECDKFIEMAEQLCNEYRKIVIDMKMEQLVNNGLKIDNV